jgi:ArsR family metal-binding transcriptional regulator
VALPASNSPYHGLKNWNAAALREGEISLNDCPPLCEETYRVKLEKLQAYLESFGWQALDKG